MSTYTQIIYQIVFSTKYRGRTLTKDNRKELFKYIWGILENKKCHLYRINGVEDHIHIVTHLHPSVSLASLVKDIKVASSLYIKEQKWIKRKSWGETLSIYFS
ncbi:IS200/IS605 family transposase [Pedobacter glucosidilyticus]|uniref:IS200/IS605 family transposase n=1 Tax=Pedobacter glucosidilyticus TaxID=1122941 RepID=UPI000410D2FE|nr:IS200/IS605 family transposase [Pedobacter glucosidilyticus]